MKKFTFSIALVTIAIGSFAQINYNAINNNMIVGDFDNDKQIDDIIAINTQNESPELLIWHSEDNFFQEGNAQYKLPAKLLNSESFNGKIVSGDFDNDGFVDDFAAIHEVGINNTCITVWINSFGQFTPEQWWYGGDFDANQVSKTLVAGDFDKDGYIDDIAAFYDYEGKQTKVFVWKSNGEKFNWPGTWWVGKDFNSSKIQGTIVVGDFDHDGFNNDIAALYNYVDDYCKIFVWTTANNKFNWPYTWFKQADFKVDNTQGNVIAGDFNKNGFVDNIAAVYKNSENSTSILVWEKDNNKFAQPTEWWYGTNEAITNNNRLVAINTNENSHFDQIAGIEVSNSNAELKVWTADGASFNLPESSWEGIALDLEECDENGNCLNDNIFDQVSIFPNPSNGQFRLDYKGTNLDNVNVSIYNILGSLVYNKQLNNLTSNAFDLSNLPKGNYVVKISTKSELSQKKLILE